MVKLAFTNRPTRVSKTSDRYRVAQKNGATLSHCKYSENSMTELRENW